MVQIDENIYIGLKNGISTVQIDINLEENPLLTQVYLINGDKIIPYTKLLWCGKSQYMYIYDDLTYWESE
jgi:hypothetical protein